MAFGCPIFSSVHGSHAEELYPSIRRTSDLCQCILMSLGRSYVFLLGKLRLLITFLVLSQMWSFHVSFRALVMPRYFLLLTSRRSPRRYGVGLLLMFSYKKL